MGLRTLPEQPRRQSGIVVAVFTVPRALMILGGGAIVLGSLMPWATVSEGPTLTSFVSLAFSVSITPFDINAPNALAMLVCGLLAGIVGVWTAATLRRSSGALLVAIGAGVIATLLAILTASSAQAGASSLGWLQSIINVAALLNVASGVGLWVAIAGGLMTAAGGVLAYLGR